MTLRRCGHQPYWEGRPMLLRITPITILFLAGILLAGNPAAAQSEPDSFEGRSETCGPIIGKTQDDLQNLREFCSNYMPEGMAVGALAGDSLLWIMVSRRIAEQMRADRLATEQLVLNWMRIWKGKSDSRAVTVWVEWQDVEIAKGETTFLSGDQVTIR